MTRCCIQKLYIHRGEEPYLPMMVSLPPMMRSSQDDLNCHTPSCVL
jgi:hypothetical protein